MRLQVLPGPQLRACAVKIDQSKISRPPTLYESCIFFLCWVIPNSINKYSSQMMKPICRTLSVDISFAMSGRGSTAGMGLIIMCIFMFNTG